MSGVALEGNDAGHEGSGMIFNASHLVLYLLQLVQGGGKHLVIKLGARGGLVLWRGLVGSG